jgi:hypothetical protein
LLVVVVRRVVELDVRLPDGVVVDPALGGPDRGEVRPGGLDDPFQGDVQLGVLVGHGVAFPFNAMSPARRTTATGADVDSDAGRNGWTGGG